MNDWELKIKTAFLESVRQYTLRFPLAKGKYRMYEAAKKICGTLPENLTAQTKDGRKFQINFDGWAEDVIYFLGEYEKFPTQIVKKYVQNGDICLDVGANIGWYSTLFSKLTGVDGQVHCFEPVPETFEILRRNINFNNLPNNIFLNEFGLGNEDRTLNIHIFEGQPNGHSSLAKRENEKSIEVPVEIKILDDYLVEKNIRRVDFVKVDVEGAELLFLQGAKKLFEQTAPPLMLIEMALNTSKNFGYLPQDLIEHLRKSADYQFYKLDEAREKQILFDNFSAGDVGANVLCLPVGRIEK